MGLEVYRIVTNATHLIQPLDKGIFGPSKSTVFGIHVSIQVF